MRNIRKAIYFWRLRTEYFIFMFSGAELHLKSIELEPISKREIPIQTF